MAKDYAMTGEERHQRSGSVETNRVGAGERGNGAGVSGARTCYGPKSEVT